MFPHADPIPVPAPVWLFKVLEIATVTLHFVAVQLLVGGLLAAALWALLSRWRKNAVMTDAAGQVAARLPILMVYVINLGVPPLLFAQVLYGRAIYTSSVLIGACWISVIFLLMLAYTLLYVMASRADRGTSWGWIGLATLAVTGTIGLIYSSNMTLMIRPQVWAEMYRSDPLGVHLNTGDPTVWPRWHFVVVGGGLCTGGVGLMFIGMLKALSTETTRFLRLWGARQAVLGITAQAAFGYWVVSTQPPAVRTALGAHAFYGFSPLAWFFLAVCVLVAALVAQTRASARGWLWPALVGVFVFLQSVAMAVVRGGIRDLTLLGYGFDVWDRRVEANWTVVAVFLALFVCGLLVVAWLGAVVARARKVEQRYV